MIRQLVLVVLHSLVFAMLLSVGLRTSIADVRAVLARRDVIARTVLMANLIVPIVAILVTAWLPLPRLARGLILIMAICPGAPLVLGRFKNQEHLPTVLLAAVSLVAVVTVPLWTAIFERLYTTHLEISAGKVALLTLRGLLLPLGLGVAVRQLWPKAADFLRPIAEVFYKVAFGATLILVVVVAGRYLRDVQAPAVLAVVIFTLAGAALGHWAGGPAPEDRKVAAILVASGNPALAAAVIAASFPKLRVGVFLVLFLVVRALSLVPYQIWMKRRHAGPGPSPKQPSPPPARPVQVPS